MTNLEQILITILWLLLGLWISYKRNWYVNSIEFGYVNEINVICNLLFAPLTILIALYDEFINTNWRK